LTGVPAGSLATIDDGIAALRVSLAVLLSVSEGRDVCPADLQAEDAERGVGAS
jgi:hypothetical protein